jgi:hypothetical protein
MRLLGAHPRQIVLPSPSGTGAVLTRLAHRVRPMTLQGAVVCSDGREIVVLHRRPWWVRGQRPVHSVARTVIPVARAGTPVLVDHELYPQVHVVRIGGTLELPVPAGSAGEAALRTACA